MNFLIGELNQKEILIYFYSEAKPYSSSFKPSLSIFLFFSYILEIKGTLTLLRSEDGDGGNKLFSRKNQGRFVWKGNILWTLKRDIQKENERTSVADCRENLLTWRKWRASRWKSKKSSPPKRRKKSIKINLRIFFLGSRKNLRKSLNMSESLEILSTSLRKNKISYRQHWKEQKISLAKIALLYCRKDKL